MVILALFIFLLYVLIEGYFMANYTYSTNVPQAAQKISATQAPIQSNFQAISELLNVNHIGFTDAINYGKHSFTTLPFQGSDPTTLSGEMALYSKSTPSGPNLGEIFYRYPSDGTVVQLTGAGGGSASSPGWCYLPTGIIMKWGNATGMIAGTNTITFPTSSPAFATSIYTVTYGPLPSYTNAAPMPYISSQSQTGFVLTVPSTTSATISWIAIGI